MMYKSLFASVNGGTYNAGTGIRTSLREQIDGIIEVFCPEDKKSELVMKPSGSGFVSFVMDIEKLKTDLGYVPRYSYLEYLRDYKKEKIIGFFNFSERSKTAHYSEDGAFLDLMSGKETALLEPEIPAHSFLWLKKSF